MKKKPQPMIQTIVSQEILEMAKKSVETDRVAVAKICAVCGSDCTATSGPAPVEDLCWVCRRLKISAWRDSDQQLAAQE